MMNRIKLYFEMFRPRTLMPPALGMIAGGACALGAAPWLEFHTTHSADGLAVKILTGAAMAAILNAASNTINQVADLENDRINKPHRVIPSGRVSVKEAWIVGMTCWAVALVLALMVGLQCFLIVAVASILIYTYSMPPLRLRARPFASNLAIGLTRGLLLPAAGWSAVKSVAAVEPWFYASVFFLFILGAATTKDFSDVEGDRCAGCESLPVKYGMRTAALIIAPFFVFPFALIPIGVHFGILTGSKSLLWGLTVVMILWGLYTVRLILKDPESLAQGENHPSWKHMYLMMMTLQVGFASAYFIFNPAWLHLQ